MKLIATHKDLGREVWGKYDTATQTWELFASKEGDDYIGCSDTLSGAYLVARDWFEDLMAR